MTFEQAIEALEMAIEEAMPASDSTRTYWAKEVFHRLGGVQDAIDQWRIGGDAS